MQSENRQLVLQLNRVLADTFVAYFKTHNYHWNVEGPLFPQLHELFKNQYDEMWQAIDEIAERVRQLDFYVVANFDTLAKFTSIQMDFQPKAAIEMVRDLVSDHDTITKTLNEAFSEAEAENQQGIMDFLAGRIEAHRKHRWFLKATGKAK